MKQPILKTIELFIKIELNKIKEAERKNQSVTKHQLRLLNLGRYRLKLLEHVEAHEKAA